VETEDVPCHGKEQSIVLTLPPLAVLYINFKKQKSKTKSTKGNSKEEKSPRNLLKKGGLIK